MTSLHDMNAHLRPGLIHFMAWPGTAQGEGPVVESITSVISDPFFQAVCITHIRDGGKRRAVRALLRQSAVEVTFGAHPRLLTEHKSLNCLDETSRREAIDIVRGAIDEGAEMGATACVFLSGPWTESTREEALQCLADSIVQIAAHARANGGLKPVLEIFDHAIDKRSLVGPAPLALRLARMVKDDAPEFGFSVDLSHTPLIGETPEQAIIPIADHLATVDIGNCVLDPGDPLYGDKHPCFGYPGGVNGVAEVAEFLRVLLRVGFLNPAHPPIVSFEVKPQPGEDIHVILSGCKRVLNRAWNMVHANAGKESMVLP